MSEQQLDWTPWPEDFARRYREAGYWQGQTLFSMLAAQAEQQPEKLALVAGKQRLNYRELKLYAERLAAGLYARGLRPGQRAVVQLPNCAEFFIVAFALFRLGMLPVFALPAHRRAEVSYFCQHTDAAVYFCADQHAGFDYRALAAELLPLAPSLQQVIVAGDAGDYTPLNSLYLMDQPLPAEPDPSGLAFFQLSGGSTGVPKLIPRTHDDYLYSFAASAEICGLSRDSVYLCVLPAGHNFPMSSPGSFGVFHAGGTVVLASGPSVDESFELIETEAVTIAALVPPLVPLWLDAAAKQPGKLASLRLLQVGGAKFGPELAARVEPALGCKLQQVFGMAEGLVNYTRLDDGPEQVLNTQGRPISADDEVRIVDDEDQPVAPGEVGHLLTRGPYTIRGYWRAADHNQRAFTADGFYRTGDLVSMNADGYLTVEGRAKDQINRGGEKISAEEVENHLLAHPLVRDVAIVAMSDPYLGERSCAFIIPREQQAIRLPQVAAFLRERGLAAYKIPDRLELVDTLPQTSVGKVSKKTLRQMLEQKLAAQSTQRSQA
ncbi:(2,3-dihydroxybenzoyl)adenylate synthase [Chromobacterium sp. S0633]|uniref:(2,3-dihydroxybenzoyl)adenylate synthase n=1 Tax=Chromobacterium sp. S0633 TaxID=2957805 RepID=UPI0020A17FF5|nr:(2,3-dihydroxybenzoyl)adenylate synthase [Chromobacterium sp. S0633]MCP1288879.1 (2,3-dihydroxybenzoyl)adenylate synthase [Chromobacterium sp. S0633]